MDARSYERASVGLFGRAGWRGVPRQTCAVVTAFFGLALSCAPSPGTSCRGSCDFCPPVPLIAVRCSPSGRGGRLRQVMLVFGKSILAIDNSKLQARLAHGKPAKRNSELRWALWAKKKPLRVAGAENSCAVYFSTLWVIHTTAETSAAMALMIFHVCAFMAFCRSSLDAR